MAWEATHLLPLVLLVLLASGSWEQQPELLRKLEGETVSVTCQYGPQEGSKIKAWCRKASADSCTMLVTHPRLWTVPGKPRCFIQDDPRLGYFTITTTELGLEDSGFYWCGTFESFRISVFKTIHLVVSRASTPPTTRSTWRTSAISPVIDSPPEQGHWNTKVVSGVTVVLLLLLVSTVLVILYLRRARGRARAGNPLVSTVLVMLYLRRARGRARAGNPLVSTVLVILYLSRAATSSQQTTECPAMMRCP